MSDDKINYEKDTRIDETALDVECLELPTLIRKYTKHQALIQNELDEEKEKLEIIKAELDTDIRTNPSDYGITKVVNEAVNNTIILNEKYQKQVKKLREIQFELNSSKGAVSAIYAKKDSLENLIKLHGQNYFAGPRVPRDLSHEVQERLRQASANKKVKLKRKK